MIVWLIIWYRDIGNMKAARTMMKYLNNEHTTLTSLKSPLSPLPSAPPLTTTITITLKNHFGHECSPLRYKSGYGCLWKTNRCTGFTTTSNNKIFYQYLTLNNCLFSIIYTFTDKTELFNYQKIKHLRNCLKI